MITKIAIDGFKCFGQRRTMRLAPITILYGKNGRGKSSVVQPLLLLAQTMQDRGEPSTLLINGKLVNLGLAEDLANRHTQPDKWTLEITSACEAIKLSFTALEGKPQLATMCDFVINGESRFASVVSVQGHDDERPDRSDISVTTSDSSILQNLKNLGYIASERRGPCNEVMRNDNLDADNVGIHGENVINVIDNRGLDFATKVSRAMSEILDGGTLRTRKEGDDRISLKLNSSDDESVLFKPVNVGFGYSYVLPVIVAALLAKSGSTLILENPEAHLHSAAQSRLMQFVMRQAKDRNVQVIIETHSDHVVNGLRIARKKGNIAREDALILFVKHDNDTLQTEIKEIECDKNGILSEEPEDFLDEWTKQLLDLI